MRKVAAAGSTVARTGKDAEKNQQGGTGRLRTSNVLRMVTMKFAMTKRRPSPGAQQSFSMYEGVEGEGGSRAEVYNRIGIRRSGNVWLDGREEGSYL